MIPTGGPIPSLTLQAPSSPDLLQALRPKFARLLQLDHPGWMLQLAADGYSDDDLKRLEELVHHSFGEVELAEKLACTLEEVRDLADQEDVNQAVERWLDQAGWTGIWEQVCQAELPDPIDAAAYVGTFLLNLAASTLAFECVRRNPSDRKESDWSMDEPDVLEGIELAEAGLAEDASEWPAY